MMLNLQPLLFNYCCFRWCCSAVCHHVFVSACRLETLLMAPAGEAEHDTKGRTATTINVVWLLPPHPRIDAILRRLARGPLSSLLCLCWGGSALEWSRPQSCVHKCVAQQRFWQRVVNIIIILSTSPIQGMTSETRINESHPH
jgi:hypothetical protein